MDEFLRERRREHVFLAILCAVGAMRFINLGFLDLQAWDEALYAVRAEGILLFGGVLDQTPFSIGGLYSSLHPPLYVWLTSVSFLAFGVTEFAARFFSALLGGATLFVVYRIGKDLENSKLGFVAAMLFGLNPFVTFYARQGQFDTTLVFLLSLSVLFYLRMERFGRFRFAVYAGFAVGAALMTKLFVGFGIPLTFFLWKAFSERDGEKLSWKPFLFSLGVTLLVALPWHGYITAVRGFGNPLFLIDASAVFDRSLRGVEGNVKPLETLYFVNQLFVLFPLGILWFVFGLYRVFRDQDRRWMFPALWFVVFFVIFSIMRTKLSVYALPMLLPASLVAAREILRCSAGSYSRKLAAMLIGGTALTLLWGSNQEWRNLAKSIPGTIITGQMPEGSMLLQFLPFIVLGCCILFLSFSLYRNNQISPLLSPLPTLLLLASFVMSFYNIVGYDRYQFNDGGRELARFVAERHPSLLVVAGFDRNPQLTFYLDGADIGWRDDLEVRRITPPKLRSEFRSWLSEKAGVLPGDALVVVEKDKLIRYEWVAAEEVNPLDYSLVFESRRYAVFQRVVPNHLALNAGEPR
ncbi:MAG: glycosyltransferase family 39 protein [Ignavibacteriales bacterium]|nr:glycosyltransferase family 39 protein [Ignavibacteriales bacterium]